LPTPGATRIEKQVQDQRTGPDYKYVDGLKMLLANKIPVDYKFGFVFSF